MTEVLLISEKFIKSQTNISDNMSGKLLLPAIREAQEIQLREIIGDALLDKIKLLIEKNELNFDENERFKTIVVNSQFFLAYQTAANICFVTAVKIDNAGLLRVSDERMDPIEMKDVTTIKNYYQNRADFYAKRLQQYILNHSNLYPELNNSNDIQSNLYSAFTSGLWLGGVRGKKYASRYFINDCCCGSNGGNSVGNRTLNVSSSNENKTFNPDEPYTGFAPVNVEGYDVDQIYTNLQEL